MIRGLLVFNGQTLGLLFGGYRQTGQTPIDAWRVLLFNGHTGGITENASIRFFGVKSVGNKHSRQREKTRKITRSKSIRIKYILLASIIYYTQTAQKMLSLMIDFCKVFGFSSHLSKIDRF